MSLKSWTLFQSSSDFVHFPCYLYNVFAIKKLFFLWVVFSLYNKFNIESFFIKEANPSSSHQEHEYADETRFAL